MITIMRLVKELPKKDPQKPVALSVRPAGGNSELEWELVASDGLVEAIVLGIRADGTVVRYIGQSSKLKTLGFQTETRGSMGEVVKIYN